MSQCTFCKKIFKNVLKHEDNCVKQFKVLIGPDYEKVRCIHCKKVFYKEDKYYWNYINNKATRMVEYGIWKHLKHRHHIENNIEDHQEKIINDQ